MEELLLVIVPPLVGLVMDESMNYFFFYRVGGRSSGDASLWVLVIGDASE